MLKMRWTLIRYVCRHYRRSLSLRKLGEKHRVEISTYLRAPVAGACDNFTGRNALLKMVPSEYVVFSLYVGNNTLRAAKCFFYAQNYSGEDGRANIFLFFVIFNIPSVVY